MNLSIIKKMAAIGLLLSTTSAQAFNIESGNYEKDSSYGDKVVSRSWQSSSDSNDFGELNIRGNVRIEQIDANNFVISNSTSSSNKTKFPRPISINLSTNGIQSINTEGFQALKAKYGKNKFANMIKNISTEVLDRDQDRLDIAVHFDLGINSVFGIVNNIRLTTEMSLSKSKCYHLGEKFDEKSNKHIYKKIVLDCIQLNSFKNTRLTEFSTNLKSEYNKVVAFAADVVVQLLLSAVDVEETLVLEQRRLIK